MGVIVITGYIDTLLGIDVALMTYPPLIVIGHNVLYMIAGAIIAIASKAILFSE
jgi:hypothetical protein